MTYDNSQKAAFARKEAERLEGIRREFTYYSLVELIGNRWTNISRLGYDTRIEAETAFDTYLKQDSAKFRIGCFNRHKNAVTQLCESTPDSEAFSDMFND